jgi:hypothetical protein
MILTAFTIFHVILSLIAIVAGVVVVAGFLASKLPATWTTVYLATAVLTSVTGFFFPVQHFLPSHGVGIISLIVLAVAIRALSRFRASGAMRRTYVITSIVALYFNFFVLVVQLFEKVPALKALAPTQSEPPFGIAQLAVLLAFIGVGIGATMKFHGDAAGGHAVGRVQAAGR